MDDMKIIFKEIVLPKTADEHLGLCLTSCFDPQVGQCVLISKIKVGSAASKIDGLLVGDRILKVNGRTIDSLKNVEDCLSNNSDKVVLLVAKTNKIADNICIGNPRTFTSNINDSETVGEMNKFFGTIKNRKNPTSSSNIILENELANLRKEMENIRLECDRLLKKEPGFQKAPNSNPFQVTPNVFYPNGCQTLPSIHVSQCSKNNAELYYPTNLPVKAQEETSSAYNSGGDSCQSIPSPETIIVPKLDINLKNNELNCCRGSMTSIRPFDQSAVYQSRSPYIPGQTYYTSKEKLMETVKFQQDGLKQAMRLQSLEKKTTEKKDGESEEYAWRLKKRSDGSCYIIKKPIKQQVLKAREEQVNRERTGLSTDDDAASELKRGRFWSRDERKKQLEKAREKKANKIQKLKNMAVKDQKIIQLSNRKQLKRSGRQLFDKFTTVQEFFVHGNRDSSMASIGGILSVTTV